MFQFSNKRQWKLCFLTTLKQHDRMLLMSIRRRILICNICFASNIDRYVFDSRLLDIDFSYMSFGGIETVFVLNGLKWINEFDSETRCFVYNRGSGTLLRTTKCIFTLSGAKHAFLNNNLLLRLYISNIWWAKALDKPNFRQFLTLCLTLDVFL